MDDNLRYLRDRATVISIIKYLLFIAIAVAILFFSSKLIVVIVPFLIGFVLAKASRQIAKGIIRIQDHFHDVFHKVTRKPEEEYVPTVEDADSFSSTEDNELFPSLEKTESESSAEQSIDEVPKSPEKKIRKQSLILSLLFPPKSSGKKSRRTKISIFVYIVLLVVTLAALVLASTALVVQLNRAINNITNWVKETDIVSFVVNWVSQFSTEKGGFLSPDQIDGIVAYIGSLKDPLSAMLPDFIKNVIGVMLSVLGSLPMLLFEIIVIIMSGFYFLSDSKMVLRFFSRNIKSRVFRHRSIQLVDQLATTLFRVLGGYLLLLMITFSESIAIFLIAGVNYAVILALITAVLDFMPVLGVSATMVPMMIYLVFQGNYSAALIVLIGMIIVTVVRRVLEPPILGNAMHMHPLATLFAMIVGVTLWGAIGFLMGPVVFLVLGEAAKGFALDKKFRTAAENILNKFSE